MRKMQSFFRKGRSQILLLESVNYLGASEYLSGRKKEES